MKQKYKDIHMETFIPKEEEELSKEEKDNIKQRFYKSARISNIKSRKRYIKWYYLPVACAVFGLCIGVTPMKDTTFAKALKSFIGIGEYLGKKEEDTYVTHVNQKKTTKDYTITLKDTIASDQKLRCLVKMERKDGKKSKLGDVQIEGVKINGKKVKESRGYGVLGKENVKNGTLHFLSTNYLKQRMPSDPKISLKINVKDQIYNFEFILKNHKFQQAEKTVKIDQWIKVKGQKIRLDKLIVTPIDQTIIVTTVGKEKMNNEEILLTGINKKGDKIYFDGMIEDGYLYGARKNDDKMTYELDKKDISYTLKTEEGEEITIK